MKEKDSWKAMLVITLAVLIVDLSYRVHELETALSAQIRFDEAVSKYLRASVTDLSSRSSIDQ